MAYYLMAIGCDNNIAIHLAKNQVFHELHFVREEIEKR